MSLRPHGTTRLPLDSFSWIFLYLRTDRKSLEYIQVWLKYDNSNAYFTRRQLCVYGYKRVKWSLYRPGVSQSVGRVIAVLFHDRGTRRGWVVSSTPRPHFTPVKDLVPIVQEAGWDPEPVWMGGNSRPHRDSIPDRPARSQSLYRLNYPAHAFMVISVWNILRIRNVLDRSFRENQNPINFFFG